MTDINKRLSALEQSLAEIQHEIKEIQQSMLWLVEEALPSMETISPRKTQGEMKNVS